VANTNQFDEFRGYGERPAACAVCEALLPEAVDKHVAGCVECACDLAEAQRGAAWLSMLKGQTPEPPAGLLAKIIAQTSGAPAYNSRTAADPINSLPVWEIAPGPVKIQPRAAWNTQWAAFRRQLSDVFSIESARATFQPRIAMTAAMAFFSIALTLNLTGVRLRDLRASSFTPSALMRTVADVDASAMRMFQNNRAVYQVESRLSELRSDDSTGDSSPAGGR
jgi:hypothetical protein